MYLTLNRIFISVYYELQIASPDHPTKLDQRHYATLLVMTGPEASIDALVENWFPRGSVNWNIGSYDTVTDFFEQHGFHNAGRSDVIYRAPRAFGIYMETFGGLPMRLFALISAANSDLAGVAFSSDDVASDGFISSLSGRCAYMRVPPSSRVDTLLKQCGSHEISAMACNACSKILLGREEYELGHLPEAVWSRVFQLCGPSLAKRVALVIDAQAYCEYINLYPAYRECPAADVISASNRRFFMKANFANAIGWDCFDTFRCIPLNKPVRPDVQWLRSWLSNQSNMDRVYEDLTKACLAGQIKGVLANDPLGCALELAGYIWDEICCQVGVNDRS